MLTACGGASQHAMHAQDPPSRQEVVDDILARGVELAWSVDRAADNGCAPLLDGEVVILAGGGDGWGDDTPLTVRRRDDGHIVWQTPSDARCPAAFEGRVAWIAAHRADDASAMSESVIVADLASGTRRCETGEAVDEGSVSSFTLFGNTLLVSTVQGPGATDGTTRHSVYSAADCSLRWSTETRHQGGYAIATGAGILVSDVDDNGSLALLANANGERLWTATGDGSHNGLLRAELEGDRLFVITGSNIQTVLRELDVRTGAPIRPALVLDGGLGAEIVEQAGVPLTLARRDTQRDSVILLDVRTMTETSASYPPHPFRSPRLLGSPLLAAFARDGSVSATDLAVAELVGPHVVVSSDGTFTPLGRFVPTRSVAVEVTVNDHAVIEVALERGAVRAGPDESLAIYVVGNDGAPVCQGLAPDTREGWSVPRVEQGAFWTNAAVSLVCTASFSELGAPRVLVRTNPLLLRMDPREGPRPAWIGVAISPPFSAATATR